MSEILFALRATCLVWKVHCCQRPYSLHKKLLCPRESSAQNTELCLSDRMNVKASLETWSFPVASELLVKWIWSDWDICISTLTNVSHIHIKFSWQLEAEDATGLTWNWQRCLVRFLAWDIRSDHLWVRLKSWTWDWKGKADWCHC